MNYKKLLANLALPTLLLTTQVSFAQGSAANSHSEDAQPLSVSAQIRQAEQNIFSLFNANNGDNRFDIRCQNYRVTGSHIPKRVCAPSFMRRAGRLYRDILRSDFNILRDQVAWVQGNDEEMRRFLTEFTDLMFSNEEFSAAVLHYGDLLEQTQVSTYYLVNRQ